MNFFQKIKNKKGFSLIELTIAISIMSVGFIGVTSLFLQNIKIQNNNKDTLVASQLAQEGLEIVRNIRDDNWSSGNDWDKDIEIDQFFDCDYQGRDSCVNLSGLSDSNSFLLFDPINHYQRTSGDISKFKRVIYVSDMGDYLDITCTVAWSDRGDNKQYVAETYLYNWR